MIRQLDLFSGIGGFALAGRMAFGCRHQVHAFVECDPFCRKVLKKHWPDVPVIEDIRDYEHDGAKIDLLTGGFPCQPFSVAGKKKGIDDDRFLWPEMFRIIHAVRPSWVIGENVAGIVKMALDFVLSDLESIGYAWSAFIIPACAVNAPHRRDRVWIVANSNEFNGDISGFYSGQIPFEQKAEVQQSSSNSNRERFKKQRQSVSDGTEHACAELHCENAADTERSECECSGDTRRRRSGFTDGCEDAENEGWNEHWLPVAARICGMAHGLSAGVDRHRRSRLKALGNSIVPQVAAEIMKAIYCAHTKGNNDLFPN